MSHTKKSSSRVSKHDKAKKNFRQLEEALRPATPLVKQRTTPSSTIDTVSINQKIVTPPANHSAAKNGTIGMLPFKLQQRSKEGPLKLVRGTPVYHVLSITCRQPHRNLK